MISTSTNSQEGQTYVALSCGISDLEGNATGVSISIDMVERRLLVLFIAEEVVGVCVCGLCSQDSLRQSRVAAIGKRQILQLKCRPKPLALSDIRVRAFLEILAHISTSNVILHTIAQALIND